jgi:hypothetical protein
LPTIAAGINVKLINKLYGVYDGDKNNKTNITNGDDSHVAINLNDLRGFVVVNGKIMHKKAANSLLEYLDNQELRKSHSREGHLGQFHVTVTWNCPALPFPLLYVC